MAGNWVIEQDIDLRCGAQMPQIWPNALMLTGDNLAHTWRVRVFDGGEAVALTGATVTGYFVRTATPWPFRAAWKAAPPS